MDTTVEQMQRVLSTAGNQVIGALVFWTLSGVRVLRSTLRERFEAMGLGQAVGRDPRPEAVLSKACPAAIIGRKGVLVRKIDRYAWAVLTERVDAATKLIAMVHEMTIEITDKGVCSSHAATPEQQPSDLAVDVAAKILLLVADAQQYADTGDLSEALLSAMTGTARAPMLAAISLRERSGGLYFVPSSTVHQAKELSAYVDEQRWGQFAVLSLHGDADNLKAASMAAQLSFAAQLKDIRTEIADFAQKSKQSGKGASEYSLDVRLERLAQLQDRVGLFADVLGATREELTQGIKEASEGLAKELGL